MMGLCCLFLRGRALVRTLVAFEVDLHAVALAVLAVHLRIAALVALEVDRHAFWPILFSDTRVHLPATPRRYFSHEDDFGIEYATLAVLLSP
jgi:hypothetical protein